jgi:hypothetical protein
LISLSAASPEPASTDLVALVDQAEAEGGADAGVVLDEQQAVGHPPILLPAAVDGQPDGEDADVVAELEDGELAAGVPVAPGAADDRHVLVGRVGDQALERDLAGGPG